MGGWKNRIRGVFGVLLLSLLAICGYVGAQEKEVQTVSISVSRSPYELEPYANDTLEGAKRRLVRERERELALLQSVVSSEDAAEETRNDALMLISEITERIEIEAQAGACLEQMGIEGYACVMGTQGLVLLCPKDAMDTEAAQIQTIHALSSVTGCEAGDIKIILTKK